MSDTFPEFAVKFSESARKSRDRLPAQARTALSSILDELTEDPYKFPDRTIPVSRDGSIFVYMYPDPPIQVTFEVDNAQKVIYFHLFSAPAFEVKKTIFISYSHKDKSWLSKLRPFLSSLEEQGLINFWDDDQLQAGEPWEPQISRILDSADAGLLLVSQDFLMSKFINETELPKLLKSAQEKGKKIFWLQLSPSMVFETHADITKYQSLLKDPKKSLEEYDKTKQKKIFVQVSKTISEVVTKH